MAAEYQDYAEPEPPGRWPRWLRELGAVVLFVLAVEADRAAHDWVVGHPFPAIEGGIVLGDW